MFCFRAPAMSSRAGLKRLDYVAWNISNQELSHAGMITHAITPSTGQSGQSVGLCWTVNFATSCSRRQALATPPYSRALQAKEKTGMLAQQLAVIRACCCGTSPPMGGSSIESGAPITSLSIRRDQASWSCHIPRRIWGKASSPRSVSRQVFKCAIRLSSSRERTLPRSGSWCRIRRRYAGRSDRQRQRGRRCVD
jgi:hypothetical protein